jgi:hypothetical protein
MPTSDEMKDFFTKAGVPFGPHDVLTIDHTNHTITLNTDPMTHREFQKLTVGCDGQPWQIIEQGQSITK